MVEQRSSIKAPRQPDTKSSTSAENSTKHDASAPKKRHGAAAAVDGPVEALTYRDPFGGVYKRFDPSLCAPLLRERDLYLTCPYRYIFSADGKYLLGGMMVGDTSYYVKLVALVKKKASLSH